VSRVGEDNAVSTTRVIRSVEYGEYVIVISWGK